MSEKKIEFSKDTLKQNKVKQDFEKNPARCQNCKYLCKKKFFVKGIGLVASKKITCRLGKFSVQPFSICNAWTGYNNEQLEV